MKDPLKQGLKLLQPELDFSAVDRVEVKDPLKQGLKRLNSKRLSFLNILLK